MPKPRNDNAPPRQPGHKGNGQGSQFVQALELAKAIYNPGGGGGRNNHHNHNYSNNNYSNGNGNSNNRNTYSNNYSNNNYSNNNHNSNYNHNNNRSNSHSHPRFPKHGVKSGLFNDDGPAAHGDGRDSTFGKNQRPYYEMKPFSTSMPFTLDDTNAFERQNAHVRQQFAEGNPGVSGEGLYVDFIYRSWARNPDRPLSEIHRSHAFRKMLQCGTVDQISAEVFHFLCGIHQCKYGDGFMRDDMELCDCDGRVSRCFVAAYIELARKLQDTEKKLADAYVVSKNQRPQKRPRSRFVDID